MKDRFWNEAAEAPKKAAPKKVPLTIARAAAGVGAETFLASEEG